MENVGCGLGLKTKMDMEDIGQEAESNQLETHP